MNRPQRQHRLDKGLKGWICNEAKKNYWRVAAWYELEDLIQDGYICYAKCNQRYRHVKDQAHFMALVKTTFYHYITDLANNRTNSVALVETKDDMLIQLAGSTPPEGEFACLMTKLPKELAELIPMLLNDAKNIPYLNAKDARTPDGRFRKRERESRNEYLCRLIRLDPRQFNLEALFRAHFIPS